MERFVKGEVVVVPFPFSDLTSTKRRPALVIAPLEGDDVIFCQITSQSMNDRYTLSLSDRDFEDGGLRQESHIRPNRIFTADRRIVLYRIGKLRTEKLIGVIDKLIEILQAGLFGPEDAGNSARWRH